MTRHPSRQAAVPDRPERYETPRGYGRGLVKASLVGMAGAALVVALLVML